VPTDLAQTQQRQVGHPYQGEWVQLLAIPGAARRLDSLDAGHDPAVRTRFGFWLCLHWMVRSVMILGSWRAYACSSGSVLQLNPGLQAPPGNRNSRFVFPNSSPAAAAWCWDSNPVRSCGLSWLNAHFGGEAGRFAPPDHHTWIWPAKGVFTLGFVALGRITRASTLASNVGTRSWQPARPRQLCGMGKGGTAISLRSSMMMAAKLTAQQPGDGPVGQTVAQGQESRRWQYGRSKRAPPSFRDSPAGPRAANPLQFLNGRAKRSWWNRDRLNSRGIRLG